MWGYSHDYFVEHGDAWIGITLPASVAGLQKFNPARYAALSFKNPTPDVACPAGRGANTASDIEEGLRWDVLSQVGALVKSNTTGRPLSGVRVQALYLTTQGGDLTTYVNAIHSACDARQREAGVRRLRGEGAVQRRQDQSVRRGPRTRRFTSGHQKCGSAGHRRRRPGRGADHPRQPAGPTATTPPAATVCTKSPAPGTSIGSPTSAFHLWTISRLPETCRARRSGPSLRPAIRRFR